MNAIPADTGGSRESRSTLLAAIAAWLLLSAGSAITAASDADGDAAEAAGAFTGRMFATVLMAFVIRGVVRLMRRERFTSPAWTPALFFTAAGLSLFSVVAASAN